MPRTHTAQPSGRWLLAWSNGLGEAFFEFLQNIFVLGASLLCALNNKPEKTSSTRSVGSSKVSSPRFFGGGGHPDFYPLLSVF